MGHDIDDAIRVIREGDELFVSSLAELGPTLVAALTRLKTLHAKRVVVVERGTGRRSDRDLLDMLIASLPKLRKGMSTRQARASGRKGGRPVKTDRMPDAEAKPIWHSSAYSSNEAALEHMPGWTGSTANRLLGKSGRPVFGIKKLARKRKR